MSTYRIASDFLTGVVSSSTPKNLEAKDLFYVLTNYRRKENYDETLLKNPNLFFLYIVYKIPFDLDVLKLLPDSYATCVRKIEIWNHYLKTGFILDDIPHLFDKKKSIMVNRLKTGNDMNADSVDIIQYITNKKKFKHCGFYSGGIPLPGMLSFEVKNLPIIPFEKTVEFLDFLLCYIPSNKETFAWVSDKELTLEEVKLNLPDVLIFEAAPFLTTKQEYLLAYVLCRKKLIILKESKERIQEIKSWFAVPQSVPVVRTPSPPPAPVAKSTIWTVLE